MIGLAYGMECGFSELMSATSARIALGLCGSYNKTL